MRGVLAMLRVARRQWRWMASGLLLTLLVMAANAALMGLSGWFIASMAVAGGSGALFNYFLPAAGIRGLAILRTVGRYAERLVTHEAAFRVLADLRVWLFRCLEPLAPAGLERYGAGDVAGRLRADVDMLESLYLRILLPVVSAALAAAAAVAVVACWSPAAALALLLCLAAAGAGIPLLVGRLAREPGRSVTALSGDLRTALTEGLQGCEELLLLGAVERQAAGVADLRGRLVAQQLRLGTLGALGSAAGASCGGLCLAAVVLLAGAEVAQGGLAGPVLVMLLLFSAASFETVATLPGALQQMPTAREAIRRILQLAQAPLPVEEPRQPVPVPTGVPALQLRQVSGSHGEKTAFRHLDLELPPGGRMALTGPSGSGKSTLCEILLRFRPYGGSIRIGVVEIDQLAGDDLRALMGVVPQRPHLFNASIRDNILLGRECGEEQLQTALHDARLADWVAGLPQGLDTMVGEWGSAVSGGEARRIALARALLEERPILLLDEPSEGLDSITEQELVAGLKGRSTGRTLLVISHRPACLALADQVMRMQVEVKE